MRPDILRAILSRETAELVRNRTLLLTILIPPIVLTAAPLVIGGLVQGEPLPPEFAAQIVAQRPDWSGLTPQELSAAFGFQQFLLFFLMMPAFIPLAIATFSIIGEKQARSLEAVLATPVRTSELLGGKSIAALVPGISGGFLSYGIFVLLMAVFYSPSLVRVVTDPVWLTAVFVLGPAIALASVVAGVIVSSRSNDPRTAQQVGSLVILPLVAITILQATGTLFVGAAGYALMAIVVYALALIGLRVGVRLFGRETILTRWR